MDLVVGMGIADVREPGDTARKKQSLQKAYNLGALLCADA